MESKRKAKKKVTKKAKKKVTQRKSPVVGRGNRTDYLSEVSMDSTGERITFTYHVSAIVYYQSVIVYEGVMPSFQNKDKNKLLDQWIYSYSTDQSGTLELKFNKKTEAGAIYTIALYKGTKNSNKWSLGDFQLFYG